METIYNNTATRPRTIYFTSAIIHRRRPLTTLNSWSSAHMTFTLSVHLLPLSAAFFFFHLSITPPSCQTPNSAFPQTPQSVYSSHGRISCSEPRMISGTSSSHSFRPRLVAPSRAYHPPSTNLKKYVSLYPPMRISFPTPLHRFIGPCEKKWS